MPSRSRALIAVLAATSLATGGAGLGILSASAGTPTAVSVGVGGSGPAKATYAGSSVVGNDDPVGPPAPRCLPQQCDQETVHLKAPAGWATSHVITLTASAAFDDSSGNTLDVSILDSNGNALASAVGVGSNAKVAVKDLAPGDYIVEVDGDIALTPTTYTGTVVASSAPRVKQSYHPTGGLSFSRETVADPFRLGTEPNVAVEPDGKTVYESPIFGFSTTQSFLQRSTDGGQTFKTLSFAPGVGKLDQCTGGGDSDLATDAYSGDIYMIDLGGAPEVPARVSHDHGQTFASSCEANYHDGANYFTDRQWLSTDLVHHQEYFIYRDGLLTPPDATGPVGGIDAAHQGYGEYIKVAPLAAGPGQAGSNQLAFTSLCTLPGAVATPCVLDVQIAGNAITDNAVRTSRFAGTTYLAYETALGVGVVVINPDNKAHPVTERVIPGNHHQILFPTVAVDRSGRIYEAWVDSTTAQVQLTSSADQGRTWTPVQTINSAPAATTVMPWVVAGDRGRVDVVFYGTRNAAPPTTNYGPWYGYMAQTLDGDALHPHWTQAAFTDRPNHIEPVCLSGLGCTTNTGPGGDRELGDFFKVTLDKDGRALISFADGDNQLGQAVVGGPVPAPSFAHFVRQASGASLYARVGNVSRLALPSNGVTLPSHTAPLPLSVPGTGAYGSDAAALNLRSGQTTILPDGSVQVKVRVAALGAPLPPAGGAQVATYLTRWVYHDHVYFAAAENDGGVFRFFAGQAQPVTDGAAIKYAYYPAGSTVTGTADTDRGFVTITVPPALVGSPTRASTLYSVTTFGLAQTAPTAPVPPSASNLFTFPQVADVLPPYNVVPGKGVKGYASVAPAVLPTRTGDVGTLSLAGLTAGPGAQALALLLASMLAGAACVRVRRGTGAVATA